MNRGYIKLWRKSKDSGFLGNANAWQLLCWCLLSASHKYHKLSVSKQLVALEPGQLVFGRKAAAKELNSTEQKIRTALKFLENNDFLTIKTTNKYSIITVLNWHSYQDEQPANNQQYNQQLTNKQPAANQQLTTNKNDKNISTREEEINTYSASALPDAASEQENLPEHLPEKVETPPEKPEPTPDKTDEKPEENPESFYLTKKKQKLTGKRLESFNRFWTAFSYAKGKAEAADAWLNIPQLTDSLVGTIIAAAEREAAARPKIVASGQTPKMAQGWISGRRWEDELSSNRAGWSGEWSQAWIDSGLPMN